MLGQYGVSFMTFLMYFVRGLLWRLCIVGVEGFGFLVLVICLVCKCAFVLTMRTVRFGGYNGCGWVSNGCVGFIGWLQWCVAL